MQIHMKTEQASLKRKGDDIHLNTSSEQRDSPVGKPVCCFDKIIQCKGVILRGDVACSQQNCQKCTSKNQNQKHAGPCKTCFAP